MGALTSLQPVASAVDSVVRRHTVSEGNVWFGIDSKGQQHDGEIPRLDKGSSKSPHPSGAYKSFPKLKLDAHAAEALAHKERPDGKDLPLSFRYGKYLDSLTYNISSFTRLGPGICRLSNCSCFPSWQTGQGNRTTAQMACRQEAKCVAFAIDAQASKGDEDAAVEYHLFFSEPGEGRKVGGGGCNANTIDMADTCLPQFDCYKKKLEYFGREPDGAPAAATPGILVIFAATVYHLLTTL